MSLKEMTKYVQPHANRSKSSDEQREWEKRLDQHTAAHHHPMFQSIVEHVRSSPIHKERMNLSPQAKKDWAHHDLIFATEFPADKIQIETAPWPTWGMSPRQRTQCVETKQARLNKAKGTLQAYILELEKRKRGPQYTSDDRDILHRELVLRGDDMKALEQQLKRAGA